MNLDDLTRLLSDAAFRPSTDFPDFPVDHVDFDQLVGHHDAETRLVAELTQAGDRGRVAVMGPSGAGKSSLIASGVARLPAGAHTALVVRAGNAGDALQDPGAFARFVLEEISHQVDAVLRAPPAKAITKGLTRRRTRESGGHTLNASLGVPHIPIGVAGQLRSTVTTEEVTVGSPTVIHQLGRVVEIIATNGLRPVIILDDTDKWAGSNDGTVDETAAQAFFHHGVRLLSDLDCDLVVAVHDRFAELQSYQDVAKRFTETIHIPRFDDPRGPLQEIIGRRIANAGVEGTVDELLTTEALTLLEAAYAERPQDLRFVLRILHESVSITVDNGLSQVERSVTYQAAEQIRGDR